MILKVIWEERFEYSTTVEVDEETGLGMLAGDIEDSAVLELVEQVNKAECDEFDTELLSVDLAGDEGEDTTES